MTPAIKHLDLAVRSLVGAVEQVRYVVEQYLPEDFAEANKSLAEAETELDEFRKLIESEEPRDE